jgi:hypothetical protein
MPIYEALAMNCGHCSSAVAVSSGLSRLLGYAKVEYFRTASLSACLRPRSLNRLSLSVSFVLAPWATPGQLRRRAVEIKGLTGTGQNQRGQARCLSAKYLGLRRREINHTIDER